MRNGSLFFIPVLLSSELSTDAWNGKELQSYNLKSNGQLCSLIAVAALRRVMSVTHSAVVFSSITGDSQLAWQGERDSGLGGSCRTEEHE